MAELKPTPSLKVINSLVKNYGKSVLSLKHKGLADLPDGGTCIRLAPDIITGRQWLLKWLEFEEAHDREIARGTML